MKSTGYANLQEAIESWRNKGNVWSAELGGIGPGYEQAIQNLLWEILATCPEGMQVTPDEYTKQYEEHVDDIASKLDEACGGFSGAQVGAAKATAYQFLNYGYNEQMAKLEDDRWILVSKIPRLVP